MYYLLHTWIWQTEPIVGGRSIQLNWLSSTLLLLDDISFTGPATRVVEADWNLKRSSEIRLFALPHAVEKLSHHHAPHAFLFSSYLLADWTDKQTGKLRTWRKFENEKIAHQTPAQRHGMSRSRAEWQNPAENYIKKIVKLSGASNILTNFEYKFHT